MNHFAISPISLTRFNALGGYARQPLTFLTTEELGFYETENGNVLGIAVLDITDQDFGGIVLARDGKLRFRGVDVTDFCATPVEAQDALFAGMTKAAQANAEEHHQGDEKGAPVDFFTHLHAEHRLHPNFVQLTTNEGYSPARQIIEPMMRWYEDADGNFVEQFQTTGFDQRIWELYLFATLIEANYDLPRDHAVPDFCCSSILGELYVEAVTVGPTFKDGAVVPPPPYDTPEDLESYVKEYMPIKFGSALFSKLKKKYWEQPHVAGKPFVFTFALITSELDLSFANVASLAAVIAGALISGGQHWGLAASAGILIAIAAGMINGVLVTTFKVPSLIATLGTSSIAGGFAFMITGGVAFVGRWDQTFLSLARGWVLISAES